MHDIGKLEAHIKELHAILIDLSNEKAFEELLRQIHQPGWTTIAEYELFAGVLRNSVELAQVVRSNTTALVEGSRLISEGGAQK